jgi:hypothetical protein
MTTFVLVTPSYLLLNNKTYSSKIGAGIGLTSERKKRQRAFLAAKDAKYPSPYEIKRLEDRLDDANTGRYVTLEEFTENEPMVERTNAMTGEKFKEKLNTPYYCSPSSETYWSM